MKYIFDLDDTLIQSTSLNNDAYNYALEKYGYERIETGSRLTREKLKFISFEKLKKIIEEKQKYFTSEWLPYRVALNSELIERIKKYGKENCYLWTKANEKRASAVLKYCNLSCLFESIIYDNKDSFNESMGVLKAVTGSDEFIIYENESELFVGNGVLKVDSIRTIEFDVTGYLIST